MSYNLEFYTKDLGSFLFPTHLTLVICFIYKKSMLLKLINITKNVYDIVNIVSILKENFYQKMVRQFYVEQ